MNCTHKPLPSYISSKSNASPPAAEKYTPSSISAPSPLACSPTVSPSLAPSRRSSLPRSFAPDYSPPLSADFARSFAAANSLQMYPHFTLHQRSTRIKMQQTMTGSWVESVEEEAHGLAEILPVQLYPHDLNLLQQR